MFVLSDQHGFRHSWKNLLQNSFKRFNQVSLEQNNYRKLNESSLTMVG